MDVKKYQLGRDQPEFCFEHWSTACRSAYEAPMNPALVLGGFDEAKYMEATAFIVTFPVDSNPNKP